MLQSLRVTNFAIIDELEVEFEKGLTTITGETGAGKSILLGALKLVLGDRADMKSLKNQKNKGIIEATFQIKELDLQTFFSEYELDYDPETIIRRELLPSGKSRAFINDTPVNINTLQKLSEQLIDIHSQFNTAKIIENDYQLHILDAYAQDQKEIKSYQKDFTTYSSLQNELERLKSQRQEMANNHDYNVYLLEELSQAELKKDELESLEVEAKTLNHAEDILLNLAEITQRFEGDEFGLLAVLREAEQKLDKISDFSEDFSTLHKRLISVRIELEDVQQELEEELSSLEANPERLNEINERLDLLQNLLRKHQVQTIDELLAIEENLAQQSFGLENIEESIAKKEKELIALENILEEKAQKLHTTREKSITKVEKYLMNTLQQLGMPNAVLTIHLQTLTRFTSTGKSKVEFLFSANKGLEPKNIEKAVSGGERSRLMLAIKKLLAEHLHLPTLILDEIDTGISGKVANDTGLVMKEMAKNMQLLVITHLPQVASKGNQQYKVYKTTSKNSTSTQIKKLNHQERLNEIAQMISGSTVTPSALDQAETLMQ